MMSQMLLMALLTDCWLAKFFLDPTRCDVVIRERRRWCCRLQAALDRVFRYRPGYHQDGHTDVLQQPTAQNDQDNG